MPEQLPHPLVLSGDLSLRTISELKATLDAALSAHQAISIDTSAVESVDTAALQLLVAAALGAASQGRTLSLAAPAGGPMARTLLAAGFVAGDGSPKVSSLSSWTITREAA